VLSRRGRDTNIALLVGDKGLAINASDPSVVTARAVDTTENSMCACDRNATYPIFLLSVGYTPNRMAANCEARFENIPVLRL
jgi:hypothetical protein